VPLPTVTRSPFLWLLLYLAATVLAGGLLAWPLSIALGAALDVSFHRVVSRTLAVMALVGVLVWLRATGGVSRAEAGLRAEPRSFLRLVAGNFAFGLLAIAPLVAMLLATGVRELVGTSLEATFGQLAAIAPLAMLTGLVVGLLEETYFRGLVMLAALRRGRASSALLATSLFFAVLHFLVPREEPDNVRWYSAFELVAEGLSRLALPPTIGAFAALTVAGLLLGAMRLRHGHLGACAGFHAGWVTGYTLTHRLTDVTAANGRSWLIGPDGVLGWLAFVWVAALLILYVVRRPRAFSAATCG
jgi:membrane protease YdiL (CAAX protease family)